jgi:hypothetical protein
LYKPISGRDTLEYLLDNILNFFDNRNTNVNAEPFNSKIKNFRANLRGVTDIDFFLFRLEKLFDLRSNFAHQTPANFGFFIAIPFKNLS